MKNKSKRTETMLRSTTNRMKLVKEKISGFEDSKSSQWTKKSVNLTNLHWKQKGNMGKQEKARYKKISDRRDRKYSHEKNRIKHSLIKKGYTCESIRSIKNNK